MPINECGHSVSNMQRKAKKVKMSPRCQRNKKSLGPVHKPVFIPPPGKSSPGRQLAWESNSHRLEIHPPQDKSHNLYIDDLSTSDEGDDVRANMYDRRIDQLMEDVSMKQEMKSKTKDHLNASRRLIEDQEEEIKTYKKDLDMSVKGYSKMQRSLEILNKEMEISKTEADMLENDKKCLKKKLVQVEGEGREAAYEVVRLKDVCAKLKKDKKMTSSDLKALIQQRDLLLEKLEGFEDSNHTLRSLLKQAKKRMDNEQQNADKCEILMQKLVQAEAKLQDQSTQLIEQDREINRLLLQVKANQKQGQSLDSIQKTLEGTKTQFQNSIRIKEAENDQLILRCKKLEEEHNTHSYELEHYQGLLAATRDKSIRDKEALKKVARLQKEKSQQLELTNGDLHKTVASAVTELETAKVTLQNLTDVNTQLKIERDDFQKDLELYRKYILELGGIMECSTKTLQAGPLHVVGKLMNKVTSLRSCKIENESLKKDLKDIQSKVAEKEKNSNTKVNVLESEVSQLRSTVAQYEALTSEYKKQLERNRDEHDLLKDKLRNIERDTQIKLNESNREVSETRSALQNKILELEPYPDLLKTSEVRLQEARERISTIETKNSEYTRLISELTQKVELQCEHVEHLRCKYTSRQDHCKDLEDEITNLKKHMQESEGTHRELLMSINRKDESMHDVKTKYDEQSAQLKRTVQNLEVALEDAKRQLDAHKEKSLSQERSSQARIMDLEGQLSRSTQSTQMLKRFKEETERKYNCRLQDMRDRLEQANSTTKSMQSYVNFLKSTYASVFTDDIRTEFSDDL